MTKPSEYLAIAYLLSIQNALKNSHDLPDSNQGIHEQISHWYEHNFSSDFTPLAIQRLSEWGFLQIVSDPYAGELLISNRAEMAQPLGKLSASGMAGLYNAALHGGSRWFARVFSNDSFWLNFESERESSGDQAIVDIELKTEIPASDRVVHLDHNQSKELESPLQEIIDLVEPLNGIDEEDGLKDLIVGKLRAGRELLRAGVFSLQSLQLTLIVGLRMLVERHRDTAISVAAGKLLDMLLAQFGMS